ncbi:MAG TPA: hypothetical protein VK949_07055 [Methylotenera sp.]|nr:hypothetical protein [Methylotenera sp.]
MHLTIISRIVRYLWSAPCTVVGLCLAFPALFIGGSFRVVAGIIEVAISKHGKTNALLRHIPFNAITFGHVVIAGTEADLHRLRRHELAHVRQYERWGILFFVAYAAASLWELIRGRHPYWDNCFEIEARSSENTR